MRTETIFLIGMRGSGKSTVGKELAHAMGYAFVDTDSVLQEQLGASISQFVECHGWEAFRRQESEVLKLVTKPRTIIATGGGIVLAQSNCSFMRERGVVVYLEVPLEVLFDRLGEIEEDPNRPSLTGGRMVDELGIIFKERETLYSEINHFRVNGAKKVPCVTTEIQCKMSSIC